MQISRDRFIIISLFCALAVSAAATGYFLWQDARSETFRIELGDQEIEVTRER